MRSHLTRLVFRRLLEGRPLSHNGCLYNVRSFPRHRKATSSKITLTTPQHRTLFSSFFSPRTRDAKREPPPFPGLEIMRDLSRAEMLDSRRPQPSEVEGALSNFFKEKAKRREAINEVDIGCVLESSAWLKRQQNLAEKDLEHRTEVPNTGISASWLSLQDTRAAMQTLSRTPRRTATTAYQELAILLNDNFLAKYSDMTTEEKQREQEPDDSVLSAITMLSVVGRTREAQTVLVTALKEKWKIEPQNIRTACSTIIAGYDDQGAFDQDLDTLLKTMAKHNVPFTSTIRQNLIRFYCNRDNLKRAIEMLETPIDSKQAPSPTECIIPILESCIRLGDEKVGRAFLERYLEPNVGSQEMWTAVFKFAAAVGRGADEVERIMSVMEKRKPADADWSLDARIINNLIKFAIGRKDPYLAERFFALGQKRSIQPNALTYLLQVQYRLSVDDVDGAIAAYEQARALPSPGSPNEIRSSEELDAINSLVQAMCKVERRYPFEEIMKIVDYLNDIPSTKFHASTVADLVVLHLRREEYHDVVDLLEMHATNYSVAERQLIRDTMVSYCFDLRNSIAKVWDSYQIFRQVFAAETPRETRMAIMNQFYKRGRADMGYHVFSHMRDSHNPAIRANNDTYVDALVGIGRCKDEETLEFVHNQLKLDPIVEPNTRLNNALMLAFIGTGYPVRALEFWKDIVASEEGPSYNSILIALRACELKNYGIDQGKEIWDRVTQLDIDVTKEVFTAWCSCLAANSYTDQTREMLKRAGEFGIELDTWVLGSIFNAAARDPYAQRDLRSALIGDYRELWKELQNNKLRRQRNGALQITTIDRTLQA